MLTLHVSTKILSFQAQSRTAGQRCSTKSDNLDSSNARLGALSRWMAKGSSGSEEDEGDVRVKNLDGGLAKVHKRRRSRRLCACTWVVDG